MLIRIMFFPDLITKIIGYNYPFRKLKKIQDLGQGNFARVSQCEAENICGYEGKILVAVKQLKGIKSNNNNNNV